MIRGIRIGGVYHFQSIACVIIYDWHVGTRIQQQPKWLAVNSDAYVDALTNFHRYPFGINCWWGGLEVGCGTTLSIAPVRGVMHESLLWCVLSIMLCRWVPIKLLLRTVVSLSVRWSCERFILDVFLSTIVGGVSRFLAYVTLKLSLLEIWLCFICAFELSQFFF